MSKKVLIIDTCLACVWLKVPEMETAGPDNNRWDFERVDRKIQDELEKGALLVLPLASIIETGNHITHIKGRDRMPFVKGFAEHIEKTIDGDLPWATYSQQSKLWEGEHFREVVAKWHKINETGRHSLGDVSILDVATAYRRVGFEVEILTADELMKAYEDVDLMETDMPEPPRRRKRK